MWIITFVFLVLVSIAKCRTEATTTNVPVDSARFRTSLVPWDKNNPGSGQVPTRPDQPPPGFAGRGSHGGRGRGGGKAGGATRCEGAHIIAYRDCQASIGMAFGFDDPMRITRLASVMDPMARNFNISRSCSMLALVNLTQVDDCLTATQALCDPTWLMWQMLKANISLVQNYMDTFCTPECALADEAMKSLKNCTEQIPTHTRHPPPQVIKQTCSILRDMPECMLDATSSCQGLTELAANYYQNNLLSKYRPLPFNCMLPDTIFPKLVTTMMTESLVEQINVTLATNMTTSASTKTTATDTDTTTVAKVTVTAQQNSTTLTPQQAAKFARTIINGRQTNKVSNVRSTLNIFGLGITVILLKMANVS